MYPSATLENIGAGGAADAWLRFWRDTAGHRGRQCLALGAVLLRALLLVATTVFLARLAQGLRSGAGAQAILAAAAMLASAFVGYGSRIVVSLAVKDYVTALRNALVSRILTMPIDRLHQVGPDALRFSTVRDCEMIDMMLSAILAMAFPALVMAAVAFVGLAVLAPSVVLPLAVVLLAIVFARRLWTRHLHQRIALSHGALAQLDEVLAGLLRRHELAVSSAREDFEADLCAKAIDRTNGRNMAAVHTIALVGELDGLIMGWAMIGGIALLVAGAVDATFWAHTVPALFLLFILRGAMHTLTQAGRDMAEGGAAWTRVKTLLAETGAAQMAVNPAPYAWQVEANALDFAHGQSPVLQGVALKLHGGKVTLVTGTNGSGKTTLIRLLLGLYSPSGGRLEVDGMDLGAVEQESYRRGIGYLPQAPVFLADSVLANVAYGQPDADPAAVATAIATVGLAGAISALPEGIWTMLDDRGSPLSGGQRQRLALARAIFGHPRLVVLDEPTNHLDTGGSETVARLIRALPGAPAVLIISHDPILADHADFHFRLAGGRLEPAVAPAVAEGVQ